MVKAARVGIALGAILVAAVSVAPTGPTATINLYADGVALRGDGSVTSIEAGEGAQYVPGSRVLIADAQSDASAAHLAAAQQAWLAESRRCGAGTSYADLVTDALLDLNTLLEPGLPDGVASASGAIVAGWSPRWRYVWPRDGAFAARALAETGHAGDALRILGFLASVQASDGSFAARYVPTGDGVPDTRADQLDGVGWSLWAIDGVLSAISRDDPTGLDRARDDVAAMAMRSLDHLLEVTETADRLPPPSSDYWERSEDSLTLGTATVVLAGLESAARLPDVVGAERAEAAQVRAAEVRDAIAARFAPGYLREASHPFVGDGRDAATSFALPPFVAELPGAERAWRLSVAEMARPAGGVAPGASWKSDGISWTPETSLYALTAAALGEIEAAEDWLVWLDEHRTASGALPEKVLADGSPAAVAPLAWTAANVVLTACALDDGVNPAD